MLQPKKTKFRKAQKGRNRGLAHRGSTIAFGSFGIKTLEPGWLTARQIEASRIAVTRYMKREGKVWIRIFPDKPVTAKPAEVRMGKGKGPHSHWAALVRPGQVLFEIDRVSLEDAKQACALGAAKLPFKTAFIVKKKCFKLTSILLFQYFSSTCLVECLSSLAALFIKISIGPLDFIIFLIMFSNFLIFKRSHSIK